MITRPLVVLGALVLLVPTLGRSQPPPLLDADSAKTLADSFRGALLQLLPSPLYEGSPGWGHTKDVTVGVKWVGQGLRVHPEAIRSSRNHGVWRKVRVTALDPQGSLAFDLRDLRQTETQKLAFTSSLALNVRADIERQKWEAGVRLSSSSLQARLRLLLTLDCEAEARFEATDALLPDAIFRLRVVRADLQYDNLVVEHVAGVGGTGARLLGEAVRGGIHRFHPGLERDLLARADAAIVRAGDTREVRVSLSKLLKK
jgi:hypothetical protein